MSSSGNRGAVGVRVDPRSYCCLEYRLQIRIIEVCGVLPEPASLPVAKSFLSDAVDLGVIFFLIAEKEAEQP